MPTGIEDPWSRSISPSVDFRLALSEAKDERQRFALLKSVMPEGHWILCVDATMEFLAR